MYPNVNLFIDGDWTPAAAGRTIPVVNPATGEPIGTVAHAERADLDRALEAADKGFAAWRKVSAFDRSQGDAQGGDLLRDRADAIAPLLTMEQGKPLAEAKGEVLAGADVIDWFAEEARRTYGRVIPARAEGIYQLVIKEPVGPVAAFTPWNFPINQVVRKLSCALAAGCSIIVKAPEETPASPRRTDPLLRRCRRAGRRDEPSLWRAGGDLRIPHSASDHPQDVVHRLHRRSASSLRRIAGAHMKRVTMELGGHAPAIVFDDADVDTASRLLADGEISATPARSACRRRACWCRNACTSHFVEGFVQHSKALKVGDGLEAGTTMGPMANPRRIAAMELFISDAVQHGATVQHRRPSHRQQGQFLRTDGHHRRAEGCPRDERGAVRPAGGDLAVQLVR